MKVVVWHNLPLSLAHGGFENLTVNVMDGLRELGVEVEPERWWDPDQKGDILQCFGRPTDTYIELAKAKGYRVAILDVLDNTASRSGASLFIQKQAMNLAKTLLPSFTNRMGWKAYDMADALQFIVPRECDIARYLFGAREGRMHVIPHGIRQAAMTELSRPLDSDGGSYLLCIATIDERKNTLLLAQAAKRAQVPVVFVGKPYSEEAPYYKQFLSEVDNRWVRYEGFVAESAKYSLLRHARGFALLSRYESGCIAVYEAAAAGLPMLLSNAPWARSSYPASEDIIFADCSSVDRVAGKLAEFYRRVQRRKQPIFPVMTWRDVAGKYLTVYQSLLSDTQV